MAEDAQLAARIPGFLKLDRYFNFPEERENFPNWESGIVDECHLFAVVTCWWPVATTHTKDPRSDCLGVEEPTIR